MGYIINIDFLVISSSIDVLSFALKGANLCKVIVVTQKEKIDIVTNLAQGGIAAVLDIGDSFENHIKDTHDVGYSKICYLSCAI